MSGRAKRAFDAIGGRGKGGGGRGGGMGSPAAHGRIPVNHTAVVWLSIRFMDLVAGECVNVSGANDASAKRCGLGEHSISGDNTIQCSNNW